jgi:hypothetical protein
MPRSPSSAAKPGRDALSPSMRLVLVKNAPLTPAAVVAAAAASAIAIK